MIYSGIRVFSDDTGCEYTSRISFSVFDIITLEEYVYRDSGCFRISGPKTYVFLNGYSAPVIILESFEFLNEMRNNHIIGKHINRIPKFEAWQK